MNVDSLDTQYKSALLKEQALNIKIGPAIEQL